MTQRRRLLQAAVGLAGSSLAGPALQARAAGAASSPKTLRCAFQIAETGFDPAQVSDVYSNALIGAIFDPPLQYEFLARPYRLRVSTLVDMPEVSADFRTFTFRVRPGIHFGDDPAFNGVRRELVAQDYVYAIKRHYDPRWKSNNLYLLEGARLLGLTELRRELMAAKKPFDYDREVDGIGALDRYTYRIRLAEPSPRFLSIMTFPAWSAVAREVVEFYGDKIMEHPVGTGAFKLKEWRRASRIVLERNPGYRDEFYDEQPPAEETASIAAAALLKGRKLPLADRVDISIIEEAQPRWLAFLNGEIDMLENVPAEFANLAMPNNQLAPNLRKRGIQMVRYPRVDASMSYFNMEDPVVGGYTPDKVALRRAIGLAVDLDKEIRLVRRNQAVPGQSLVAPGTWGYDPAFKSEMSEFDRARAKALLDMHGYVDRDGDGWREQPDGSPLLLERATQPDATQRQLDELLRKDMAAVGLKMVFRPAKWPENLKAAQAGKLMMWGVGSSAAQLDGQGALQRMYSPAAGGANLARFRHEAFDRLYERMLVLPDGPERDALFRQAKRIAVAWAPYKNHLHRFYTDLAHPWLIGYRRPLFWNRWWHMIDIDDKRQPPAR